jgi:hypothetical protein
MKFLKYFFKEKLFDKAEEKTNLYININKPITWTEYSTKTFLGI